MREALIASDSVSVGNSPSGTSATITPMANRNPSRAGVPSQSETPKNNNPAPTAKAAITFTAWSSSARSGVRPRTTSPVNRAMPPSNVSTPVLATTTSPEPAATNVPAKTRFVRSISSVAASRRIGSASRDSASDSPVSVELSTRRLVERTTRASAEMRSPSRRSTTSPGTSSAARIDERRPSR